MEENELREISSSISRLSVEEINEQLLALIRDKHISSFFASKENVNELKKLIEKDWLIL